MADARMKFADARLYLIYFFAHQTRNAVCIIRAKSLERLVVVAYLLILVGERFPLVGLSEERGTVKLHVALDAVDTEAQDHRLEIEHLFNRGLTQKKLFYLFLQAFRNGAPQEV